MRRVTSIRRSISQERQDKEALESFTRAIELDKDFAEGYLKLGLAYDALIRIRSRQGLQIAIEAFEKKIKSDPENGRAHYRLVRPLPAWKIRRRCKSFSAGYAIRTREQ